jgi:hypothetical protein
MASQAAELGLRVDAFKRSPEESEEIDVQESLTGLWKLFEWLPFERPTYSRRRNSQTHK